MARIRTIKPDFFMNDVVAELDCRDRVAFIGLWTEADKRGRMEDRPMRLRARIFPYEPAVDMDAILDRLAASRLIVRYIIEDTAVISVVGFEKHQRPHPKEPESVLPVPPDKVQMQWKPSREQIYFIRNTAADSIKIGRSRRVEVRLKELQTGSAATLELVASIPGGSDLEVSLQKEFADLKLEGEWFKADPRILIAIDREKKRQEISCSPSIPSSPVGREGNGREGDLGREGGRVAAVRVSTLTMSPAEYANLQRFNAYVGSRLRVPHKLHRDFVAALGGVNPDTELRTFYAAVDGEIEASGESIVPDVWKWLEARFRPWAKQRADDVEMAKFLSGEVS